MNRCDSIDTLSRCDSFTVFIDFVLTDCISGLSFECNHRSVSDTMSICNEGTGECLCKAGWFGYFCEDSRCKYNLKIYCVFNEQLFTVL